MLLAEARYNVVLYILFGGFPLSTTIHAYVVPVETGPEDGTEDDTTWPVTYDKATCVLKLASRCGELSKDCSIMPSCSHCDDKCLNTLMFLNFVMVLHSIRCCSLKELKQTKGDVRGDILKKHCP